MTRVTGLPWRRIAAGLPAVALVGTGLAFAATGGTGATTDVVSDSAPLVRVPNAPLTRLDAPVLPPLPALPAPVEVRRTSFPDAAALPASMTANNGIPAAALSAYQRGAQVVDAADPQCRVDWALVAGIGKVESNHGRYGGNGIDRDGTVRPGIYGIPLDGAHQTAVVHDTDGGSLDRDGTWDRAVGPMQFIPATWRTVGVDANGDGVKDPQNLADAATATAVYLCSGPGDLSTDAGARSAVLRYNHSEAYADTVLGIAAAYRGGYTVLPAVALSHDQRNGAPYLPSGDPQPMESYDPALATVPPGRPAVTPANGGNATTSLSASGAKGGTARGPAAGGGAEGATDGTGRSTSTPTVSPTGGGGPLTGAAVSPVGTVGSAVGGLTGSTSPPKPSSSSASTQIPTAAGSSTTSAPALPLTVLPKNGVCPDGYRLNVLRTLCVKI
ncbi:lytic transglycosylase domain-containing protein [Pedococcus sp. 5OH_020]|uniref:lytic transglycosylase domain-containing protein n=1 Tax=Pedococcus sp. 5OH_020 TaxID=2989814 RepID=UPI0022EA0E38|nr:lytic murein transglycosylase [Pedococcus sp. 5OH_020]